MKRVLYIIIILILFLTTIPASQAQEKFKLKAKVGDWFEYNVEFSNESSSFYPPPTIYDKMDGNYIVLHKGDKLKFTLVKTKFIEHSIGFIEQPFYDVYYNGRLIQKATSEIESLGPCYAFPVMPINLWNYFQAAGWHIKTKDNSIIAEAGVLGLFIHLEIDKNTGVVHTYIRNNLRLKLINTNLYGGLTLPRALVSNIITYVFIALIIIIPTVIIIFKKRLEKP